MSEVVHSQCRAECTSCLHQFGVLFHAHGFYVVKIGSKLYIKALLLDFSSRKRQSGHNCIDAELNVAYLSWRIGAQPHI